MQLTRVFRSRQAIKKYVQANNSLGNTSESAFNNHMSRALATGETNGVFERPKGKPARVSLRQFCQPRWRRTTTTIKMSMPVCRSLASPFLSYLSTRIDVGVRSMVGISLQARD